MSGTEVVTLGTWTWTAHQHFTYREVVVRHDGAVKGRVLMTDDEWDEYRTRFLVAA